ncbi:MAG: hydratase [Sarcina sp.]
MIKLIDKKVWFKNEILVDEKAIDIEEFEGKLNTITGQILKSHNTSGDMENLKINFDALASHDITYVGVIQTARASGLKKFNKPYVLTNCHNSLCAVGGTLNDDDHLFGLTAAKKYGGIYVPQNQAVIHQYMRERMAKCGSMILGTDSHTRYGALGTISIGEGGGEIVKQLLDDTYDIKFPKVICVYLEGSVRKGIGPQDVALALIREVFKNGFAKNNILEFIGDGVHGLSVDFRNGVDVMTTETACLSSIWKTDEKVLDYYKTHKREKDFKALAPRGVACYDGMVYINLAEIESMIALPFHPSNAYTIKELNANLEEILAQTERKANKQIDNKNVKLDLRSKIVDGRLKVDQGEIAGCSGGMYENIKACMNILKGKKLTNDYYSLNIYPASTPIYTRIMEEGIGVELMKSGAIIKTAFCGPCFGAGDVPATGSLSIRHTTRNFPNREGSKPIDGQIASVALMDARSIAATSLNGGYLTAATDIDFDELENTYVFDEAPYSRVFDGYEKENSKEELIEGPNIEAWPEFHELKENLLLQVAAVIDDEVTTTDELIPSGEASTYRSNPILMSEFTLSRREPKYLDRAKATRKIEDERFELENKKNRKLSKELESLITNVLEMSEEEVIEKTTIGSVIYANKPGDGSAREQAASCQRVLGGRANIAVEYATKRYRSNMINWGLLPFTTDEKLSDILENGDYIYIENIRESIISGRVKILAKLIKKNSIKLMNLNLDISAEERKVLLDGCLINFYKNKL